MIFWLVCEHSSWPHFLCSLVRVKRTNVSHWGFAYCSWSHITNADLFVTGIRAQFVWNHLLQRSQSTAKWFWAMPSNIMGKLLSALGWFQRHQTTILILKWKFSVYLSLSLVYLILVSRSIVLFSKQSSIRCWNLRKYYKENSALSQLPWSVNRS